MHTSPSVSRPLYYITCAIIYTKTIPHVEHPGGTLFTNVLYILPLWWLSWSKAIMNGMSGIEIDIVVQPINISFRGVNISYQPLILTHVSHAWRGRGWQVVHHSFTYSPRILEYKIAKCGWFSSINDWVNGMVAWLIVCYMMFGRELYNMCCLFV